jgi:hypothetical protein
MQVQVLITCSLIMLTCLTWFVWVVHTFVMARRARVRREQVQWQLAVAGVPVPVSVPAGTLRGVLPACCADAALWWCTAGLQP